MAVTITSTPAVLTFANNPIVFKASTDHALGTDESFLRIRCNATFTVSGSVPYYTGSTTFTTPLSQPVANKGTAVFNLSDAAQTLVRNIQSQMDMNDADVLTPYSILADVSFTDVWVYDNQEVEGTTVQATQIVVVPGGLTDFELLTLPDIDLPTLSASGIRLSRKPDGGILYMGEQLIVPVLYGSSQNEIAVDTSLSVGGTEVYSGSSVVYGQKADYHTVSYGSATTYSSAVSEGLFVFDSSLTGSFSGHFSANLNNVHQFRFINGFGMIENISVHSKDKLNYTIGGETHSLVQQISTRPTDRRYSVKTPPVGVFEMSSGYVPKRWAEWFVQELFASPRVWMLMGTTWIPVLIEVGDECVIYDRTSPSMPHVDFTVRLAIDGTTRCTWT